MSSTTSYTDLFTQHRSEHPAVLKLLIRYAKIERLKGRQRVSIRAIWESIRLEHPGMGGLNDHLHSRYARLIMQVEPELQGMFSLRSLRTN